MDRFGEIVFDLGEELQIPLNVDNNGACKIQIGTELTIQMQMSQTDDMLLFVAELGDLPPGNYRRSVLFEALRSNSQDDVDGYLAFVEKLAKLFLCDNMASEEANARAICVRLESLLDRGKKWKSALQKGELAPQEELQRFSGAKGSGPMFGL